MMMMMMMRMMMMIQFQTILAVTGVQDDLKTCAPIKRGEKKRALASSQRSSLRGAILARRGSLRRSQRQRYDDISGFWAPQECNISTGKATGTTTSQRLTGTCHRDIYPLALNATLPSDSYPLGHPLRLLSVGFPARLTQDLRRLVA